MTDNEIIKALECCIDNDYKCNECPLYSDCEREIIAKHSLDIINRQKAEIEKLKQNNDILSRNADTAFQVGLNESKKLYKNEVETEIKSKAIKEFAERLKKLATVDHLSLDGEEIVCVDDIDNLVKEMTEEYNNGN